jgi:hypothetical protein
VGTIRCAWCNELIDSAAYPAHEAKHHEEQRKHGVSTSLPPSLGRAERAFALQPDSDGSRKQLELRNEDGEGPHEFVVRVVHAQTGRVFSPFIVRAGDEAAARKLCQRNYLTLQSVERYIEQEGSEKPGVLPYGPPVSDRDFELDYGNRPGDTSTAGPAPWVFASLGWFFLGPLGAVLGWWAGNSSREQHPGE